MYCKIHNAYYDENRDSIISIFVNKKKPSKKAKEFLEDLKYDICKILESRTGQSKLFTEIFPEKLNPKEIVKYIDNGV
jgi:hypothetical protein